jgi:hypothetical protein
MSRPVRNEHEGTADVPTVFSVLTSEEFAARKAERFRDDSRIVRRDERPDGGVTVVVSRELPAGVPGFLQRFLPKDARVVETHEWAPDDAGTRRGTWSVDIAGAPARLGGTMSLTPTARGCRHVIEGEVTVTVPLLGGKAEAFISEMVQKLAQKEAELLAEQV